MSSLYQINDQVDSIMAKIQSAFDESTGEIVDEELYTESQKELDNLEIAQNDKIENIACYIKNLCSEVFALENEIKTLSQRKKVKENQLKRVKEYLANFLKLKGIKKLYSACPNPAFMDNKMTCYFAVINGYGTNNPDEDEFLESEIVSAEKMGNIVSADNYNVMMRFAWERAIYLGLIK